jgi:hypothetical protein
VERLGRLVIRNNDDAGGIGGANEEGQIKSTRRRGESGHTSAPRTSAQMAAYTLKGLRVFKVRKQLADEGKNHAELILVEVPCQS